jgi:hypothetical protein
LEGKEEKLKSRFPRKISERVDAEREVVKVRLFPSNRPISPIGNPAARIHAQRRPDIPTTSSGIPNGTQYTWYRLIYYY